MTRIKGLLLALVLAPSLSGCVTGLVLGGTAAGASMIHDRRTSGTIVEDQAIELKAHDRFINHPELADRDRAHINVTSYNKAVLLSGEVATPAMRQQAEEVVRNIANVKYIHNELIVEKPTTLAERTTDAALTTAVKGSLFGIRDLPGFDPTRVKVVTQRGTVYLFGLLHPREAEAVTETVRRVRGVQKVVKLFEYIE